MGLNLGFGDVKALTETLATATYNGSKLDDLNHLCAYETKQLRKNVPIMLGTHGLQRLYSTDIGPIVLARSIGLQITQTVTPLKVSKYRCERRNRPERFARVIVFASRTAVLNSPTLLLESGVAHEHQRHTFTAENTYIIRTCSMLFFFWFYNSKRKNEKEIVLRRLATIFIFSFLDFRQKQFVDCTFLSPMHLQELFMEKAMG